jgi:acyl-CoA thioesterase II
MTKNVLDELVELLALERIEENLFRGQSQDLGWGAVFGERHAHSLHAYFLRSGDVKKPIVYDVDRIRDGGSFTTRRVVAIQNGHAIFNMAASFQVEEPGLEHQDVMPAAPEPESCATEQERARPYAHKLPRGIRERATAERPFELRPVGPPDDAFHPAPKPPARMVWFKTVGRLPDDPALHRYLLAYASDHSLITTALLPHGITWLSPDLQIASLDHVMWFHQRFRVDEWLLYVLDSPAAHGARGLARGRIFTRDGRLVASVMQEGLIRQRAPR